MRHWNVVIDPATDQISVDEVETGVTLCVCEDHGIAAQIVRDHNRAEAFEQLRKAVRDAVRRLSDMTTDLENAEYSGGSEDAANIAFCLDAAVVAVEKENA